jgi:hypothetical protein
MASNAPNICFHRTASGESPGAPVVNLSIQAVLSICRNAVLCACVQTKTRRDDRMRNYLDPDGRRFEQPSVGEKPPFVGGILTQIKKLSHFLAT